MGSKRNLLIAAAVVVIAVVIWLVVRTTSEQPELGPATAPPVDQQPVQRERFRPTPPPPAEPEQPAAPEIVEPPANIDQSDPVVLEAVQDFAPRLVAWLTPEQQIRKWVLAVDNLAAGNVVGQHQPLAFNPGKFQVDNKDGRMVMSEANYSRAEALIDTVVEIPPEQLVRYYKAWLPTLNKAYGELGRDNQFDERLHAAIDQILAVEPLEQPPELEQPSVFYTYADETLENADDLTKLMWRLGPENTRRIQDYLREFKQSL